MLFQSSERMGSPGENSTNSGISVVAMLSAPRQGVGASCASSRASRVRDAPRVVLGQVPANAAVESTRQLRVGFREADHVREAGLCSSFGPECILGGGEQVLHVHLAAGPSSMESCSTSGR